MREPTKEELIVVFDWLGKQCAGLDSPVVQSAARKICERHQSEIRGLEGAELALKVNSLWLGYVSEAKAAIWAVIHTILPEGTDTNG